MEFLDANSIVGFRRKRPNWPGRGMGVMLQISDGHWRRVYAGDEATSFVKQGDKRMYLDDKCRAKIAELRSSSEVG
ncbi:hypothetical protein WHZ77_06115 [Bradyrhizobium sp. A5]|uniref:hypothetical protein n=1 Tax=Bradyrhizobium sp. A5 TaxID=3133696 RepID=UPI00324EF343